MFLHSTIFLLASLLVFASGASTNIFQPLPEPLDFDQQNDDFDDDRHIKDPDDKDATNAPSIEGFTRLPSSTPSRMPSSTPSKYPSHFPSVIPTPIPSSSPQQSPSYLPSRTPSHIPSDSPSRYPSTTPTESPSLLPSYVPSAYPSIKPSEHPTDKPSRRPSLEPTVLPSRVPSISPSSSPSKTPTSHPSSNPTSIPTFMPSSKPSVPDPCEQIKLNKGSFGNITSDNLLVIHYLYEVETDPIITENMLASIGDILYAIELDLSVELVKNFFPECGGTQNPGNEIVGIHARPYDLANGDLCFVTEPKINRKCDFVEGRVSFYLEKMELLSTLQMRFKNVIKTIMDAGKLNDSFPSIDKVTYVDGTILIIGNDDFEIVSDDENIVDIFGLGSLSWGLIGIGVVVSFVGFGFARYRYYSTRQYANGIHTEDSGIFDDDSADYYFDVDSTLSNS